MKKQFKIISIFVVIIMLFSLFSVFADEESENLEKNYISSDVYRCDKEVSLDTAIDGNAFICAETLNINTEINGDVFACASNIVIGENAIIYGNLFAVSENIENKGIVNEVFSVAKTFTISNGYVYRDLKLVCDTLNVYGSVGRNAYINVSNINFNTAENSNSIIYGDLNYTSTNELTVPDNSVQGKTNFTPSVISKDENRSVQSKLLDYFLEAVTHIVFVIAIALVLLWLTPKFADKSKAIVANNKAATVGYGLLGLLVTPIICTILVILNVTSAVSLLLLALYIIALVISKSIFTIVANNCICNKLKITNKPANFGILALISLIIWCIDFIPYVGGIVSFIFMVLGLGILILAILPKRCEKAADNSIKSEK